MIGAKFVMLTILSATMICQAEFTVSYKAGTRDSASNFMGGTEFRLLTVHKGKLFGGIETWMDSITGTGDPRIGAQILRLDGPASAWKLDHHFDELIPNGQGRMDVRNEGVTALRSIVFANDSAGRALARPDTILIAACRDFTGKASVYIRNDTTGAWAEQLIADAGTNKATVRSFVLYRDKVTGADVVIAGSLPTGLIAGVYDPTSPTRIRWRTTPELIGYAGRPMEFTVCNGDLYVAIAPAVNRRTDGANPHWDSVFTYPLNVTPGGSSGLRGLTAIPSPNGQGQSVLSALEGGRGIFLRLDPRASFPYDTAIELNIMKSLSDAWGYAASYVVVANSNMTWVKGPADNDSCLIVTVQHHPAKLRADAYYYVRHATGASIAYQLMRIDNTMLTPAIVLNSTRACVVSPFPGDHRDFLYLGGYDADNDSSHNTAYVLRVDRATALGLTTSAAAQSTLPAREASQRPQVRLCGDGRSISITGCTHPQLVSLQLFDFSGRCVASLRKSVASSAGTASVMELALRVSSPVICQVRTDQVTSTSILEVAR